MSAIGDRRVDPGRSRNRPHGNVGILRIAVVILFLVLGARLVQMQIVDGAEYAERSELNRIIVESVQPTRGLIFDRKGQPLVQNSGSFTALITPAFLPEDAGDRYRLYLYLEDLLGIPALQIEEAVTAAEERGQRDLPLPIVRALDRQTALMLEQVASDLPGVTLAVEPRRLYLGGPEFSHILGYVGPQSPEEWRVLQEDGYAFNEVIGKVGVEARYQGALRGIPGVSITEVDAQGDLITTIERTDAEGGRSLLLSIDSDLQRYVYELLTNTMGEATTAAAVVMSPVTGEIYAIVSVPTYDNNIFSLPDPGEEYRALLNDPRIPLLHQALSPVAPGSTFKIITAAAALQEGNITRNTRRDVNSSVLEFIGEDGQPYYFYDWRVHGDIDLVDAISWSSNIYFYMASCGIPQEGIAGLGANTEQSAIVLGYYARSFGLGQVTGLDIASTESPGVIPSPEWKRRVRSGPPLQPRGSRLVPGRHLLHGHRPGRRDRHAPPDRRRHRRHRQRRLPPRSLRDAPGARPRRHAPLHHRALARTRTRRRRAPGRDPPGDAPVRHRRRRPPCRPFPTRSSPARPAPPSSSIPRTASPGSERGSPASPPTTPPRSS